ncbi:hypothetical protein [Pseudarthrobacter sp. LMD1-1-1.1]|uniref:hypothetical protein n=1 Tax=Pseudarthrobacter sp. LMD1-1-1.1 TaxID=3135242 RepID=UPI0034429AF2
MRIVKCLRHRGRVLIAGLLMASLMAGAPAANAVFTRTLNAGTTSVGTYKLASPTGNVVTVTCTPNGGSSKFRLTITVTSHGTVAKANNYVLIVKDFTGLAASPVPLNPGGSYTAPSPGNKWTYSVDAQYKVPGTSYAWSSTPNPVTVC